VTEKIEDHARIPAVRSGGGNLGAYPPRHAEQMFCMSHAGRLVAGSAWSGMAGLRYCAGSMLWLSRKMLSGS